MYVHDLTPILNVSNLAESFAWFEKIGWQKLWDWGTPPTFGAVGCGQVEIFLCLNAQGVPGGVWMSWFLATPADVDAAHTNAVAHGLTITRPPADEPWRVREFHLRHPDGHTFRVGSGLCPT